MSRATPTDIVEALEYLCDQSKDAFVQMLDYQLGLNEETSRAVTNTIYAFLEGHKERREAIADASISAIDSFMNAPSAFGVVTVPRLPAENPAPLPEPKAKFFKYDPSGMGDQYYFGAVSFDLDGSPLWGACRVVECTWNGLYAEWYHRDWGNNPPKNMEVIMLKARDDVKFYDHPFLGNLLPVIDRDLPKEPPNPDDAEAVLGHPVEHPNTRWVDWHRRGSAETVLSPAVEHQDDQLKLFNLFTGYVGVRIVGDTITDENDVKWDAGQEYMSWWRARQAWFAQGLIDSLPEES